MASIDVTKFEQYIKCNDIYDTYPDTCLPAEKLKTPAGAKSKKLLHESFDHNLYEPEARMVAFKTTRNRIRHWIKTLNIYLYEYLGAHHDNTDHYDIKWYHDPEEWTPQSLRAVCIDVSTKKDAPNPLVYKVSLFLKTGTIQTQGNGYETFAKVHFPIMKCLMDVIDPPNTSIPETKESTYMYK